MNRVKNLEVALKELFCSGADAEHDAEEMMELLEGMDYHALLQAFHSTRQTVYAFRVDCKHEKGFNYRGPELFPTRAVLLYTEDLASCYDAALSDRAYELWLLPDASFRVVSRIRIEINCRESVAEYRTIKGADWKDAGMFIDFLDLADDFDALVAAVDEHELPIYEL